MSESIRITVLVENSAHRPGLVAEHGLSFHIQAGKRSLLFDTGQTDLALINAQTLRLPLEQVEAVVLSHGHYDHTGGVPAILDVAPEARVYLHPAAFAPKFSRNQPGPARMIGMSEAAALAIRQHPGGFIETPRRTEILDGIFVTGEIPRVTTYEDTGGAFYLDADGRQPDPLVDDQALVIDLGRSVVLLLGCAHAGVVNTLEHVRQLTDGKPVSAVIGGLHLGKASGERLLNTVFCLSEARLDCLAPAHCTGEPATTRLRQSFMNIFRPADVGAVFEFSRNGV